MPPGDSKIYVNGAFVPRYMVRGQVSDRPVWRVGNLTLTGDMLELSSRTERFPIPISGISQVAPPTFNMIPPPVEFPQALAVQHVEGGVPCVSLIAFPAVTMKNFPMQLAAILTGTVKAFLPRTGPQGVTYEEVWLTFQQDRFVVRQRVGVLEIPLEKVSSLTPARRKDSQGRDFVEWTIDYLKDNAVTTLNMLSYERPHFLLPLLMSVQGLRKNAAVGNSATAALSEQAQQVITMLYTGGVSTSMIEQMLALKPEDLDKIYDDLVRLGLADVVKVRKEIALNAAGMKAVDEIMKKQLEMTSR